MHYSKIRKMDVSNGPGVRVSIFMQGCTFNCFNCFNKETHNFEDGLEFDDSVIDKVLELCGKDYIKGLSILGGEPLHPLNIDGTTKLSKKFKEKYPNKTLWIWTGFLFDKDLKDKEILKYADVIVDGRYVDSLHNFKLEWRGSSNQRVIDVKKSLENNETIVLEVNALKSDGLKNIKPALLKLLKEKHDRLKAKGLVKITTRVMVVGIPNVGKSTFINKMAKNNIAKTGDRPGVTKSKQWIKTSMGIELLDTPGVLWPKFEDEQVGLNLAFTGAIKDEIMDTEELAFNLVKKLEVDFKDELMQRYKLEDLSEETIENLDNIARKRGCLISGGNIDYNRIASILLDEFRAGKIGKISLERP